MAPTLISAPLSPDGLQEASARIRRGEIGIIPTDTLYGLSGDATRDTVVARINRLKGRAQPATLIPHDLAWAASLVEPRMHSTFLDLWNRYRGDTLLFKYAGGPLPHALVSVGLVSFRGPQHWILDLAAHAQMPLVTTSANVTGQPPMTCMDDLDPTIRAGVDFIITEGTLTGPPSALVHLDGAEPRRVVRS